MSDTFRRIVELVRGGNVQISVHGYDEMAADGILAGEAIEGAVVATVVEDYPDYFKGAVYSRAAAGSRRESHPRRLGNPERGDVARGAGHSLSA